MRRFSAVAAVAALIVVVLLAAGCSRSKEPELKPKVAPPAIAQEGTLTAGVDLAYPPFAGTDQGRQAGLDIDVARALAQRLGLKVAIVDVKPSDAATALAEGKADVVLSVPFDETLITKTELSGSYLLNGPVFFRAAPAAEASGSADASGAAEASGSAEPTAPAEPPITFDTVTADVIGAQEGSLAYWLVLNELGEESVKTYPTLRAALEALDRGEIELVAGDAIVGAYIARDLPNVRLGGQLQPAAPLAVATALDNTALSDAVREALDGLAADGYLSTIRRKWIGEFPMLEGPPLSDEETATP